MNKYIEKFEQIGVSIINIKQVCNGWNDKFVITVYNNEKYNLIINIKGKNGCKTEISESQAKEIILKLNLIYVQHSIFSNSGSYQSRNFIDNEIKRLRELKFNKECELNLIRNMLNNYIKSI